MGEMEKRIKLLKKLDVTELDGEKVMVDFETGKYFMIKGVGNDIFDMLKDGIAVSDIIENLLKEYDVTRKVCCTEVLDFLKQMEDCKFIELV